MQIYLVGGAVRDELLGRKVTERDWVVVGATPEQLLEQRYQQVGKDFPVFLHPKTNEEYALARTERKSGAGYTGFHCQFGIEVTLEDDLIRRDLTVNAMAKAKDGTIIDPYGGRADLDNKILRHVSDAFVEDPLRVLRVARFAARYANLGFTIAPETMTLMSDIAVSGELEALTVERVWKETARALLEDEPQVYFETLRSCGALKILFPEVDVLWGIPNPEKWHPEIDTGIHTMMVLKQARMLSDELETIFAALVHDLGKAKTDPDNWPHHHGHEKLGLAEINQLSDRLKVPNACRDIALLACEFHTHCHRAFELRPETLVRIFDRMDLWRKPQRLEQFIVVCLADHRGRTGFENAEVKQADYIRQAFNAAALVTAKDIIAKGFKGAEIKEQINLQRITRVREFKESAQKA